MRVELFALGSVKAGLENKKEEPHRTAPHEQTINDETVIRILFGKPKRRGVCSIAYAINTKLFVSFPSSFTWQVSWMRHFDDNVQLLSVGDAMYSNDDDKRMSIAWRYPGNWTLNIGQVKLEDSGCYHCQVNTHPPIGLFVHLLVQGSSANCSN